MNTSSTFNLKTLPSPHVDANISNPNIIPFRALKRLSVTTMKLNKDSPAAYSQRTLEKCSTGWGNK